MAYPKSFYPVFGSPRATWHAAVGVGAYVIEPLSWATDSLLVIRRLVVFGQLVNNSRHKKTSRVEAMEAHA